jgi:hypothetical protein
MKYVYRAKTWFNIVFILLSFFLLLSPLLSVFYREKMQNAGWTTLSTIVSEVLGLLFFINTLTYKIELSDESLSIYRFGIKTITLYLSDIIRIEKNQYFFLYAIFTKLSLLKSIYYIPPIKNYEDLQHRILIMN